MKFIVTVLSVLLSFGMANAHQFRFSTNITESQVIAKMQEIDSELVDNNHKPRALKLAYEGVKVALQMVAKVRTSKVQNPVDADIIALLEQMDTELANRNPKAHVLAAVFTDLKYIQLLLVNNRTGSAGVASLVFDDNSQLNFGISIVNGFTPTRLVSITNNGTATASSITAAASNMFTAPPSNFNVISGGTCGTTLAAGASCTINVEFRALSFGTLEGVLTVSHANGSITRNLVGNGSN